MSADRILVVGSYPPLPVPGAPVTIEEVRRAWADGREVTVVSPRLSAAQLAVPVTGILAGRRLERLRRRTGTRELVLVAEPGYPLPDRRPARQVVTAAALAVSLRRFDHVRLVLAGAPTWTGWAAALVERYADETAVVAGGASTAGVTPVGPPEVRPRDRPAILAGMAARRLLGPAAPTLRRRLGRARRGLRSARRRLGSARRAVGPATGRDRD